VADHINSISVLLGSVGPATADRSWISEIIRSIVAPAVVAVFFTGLTSFALERLKGKREAVTSLCLALREELAGLQDIGSQYWSRERHRDDPTFEAKIISQLQAVTIGLRSLQEERRISLDRDLDEWIVRLTDSLTGGGFQTKDRAADLARVREFATQISRMRYKIFDERLKRL